jgi:thiamine kinase-like enzyme
MPFTLHLHKLIDYGRSVLKQPAELWTLKTSTLDEGMVAAAVYRHELTFRLAEGSFKTIPVVQKFTNEAEVRTMRALSNLSSAEAIPALIDSAISEATLEDKFAHWFITPFYEGAFLTFEDEVPRPIIETLARIHAYFAPRVEQVDWLYRVNSDFFRAIFDNALTILKQTLAQNPHPIFIEARRELIRICELSALYQLLESLPVTLAHGDVHPGNMISLPNGNYVLIDWGNARVALAMLDLANMIELDSANWFHYLAAWEAASGQVMDPIVARRGYDWATVMVNLQYLPYAIAYRPPERVQEMMGRLLGAVRNITTND